MNQHVSVSTAAGTFDGLAAGPSDGRGVLLLHGFPQAALEWEHQLGALGAAGYRAVAVDQRGYSPDVRPEAVEEYRDEHLVADALAVADSLGWQRFDVVGHDWGAHVAWAVAGRHPDRVRTLTAVSVPHPSAFGAAIRGDEDQHARSQYMQMFRQKGTAEKRFAENPVQAFGSMFDGAVPADHVREYRERFAEPAAVTAALNWYRAMHLSPGVDPITVPTMYVWSTEDVAVGSVAAFGTQDWVTGPYRFEMLEDVSHWVPEQAAEALSALLLEHLAAY